MLKHDFFCSLILSSLHILINKMCILDEIVLNEEDPLLVGSKITKKRKLEEVNIHVINVSILQLGRIISEIILRVNMKE